MCIRDSPSEILQEGDKVQVRVLLVDCARQRLGLSLKLEDNTQIL
jgi:ribosomal protein S1